MKRVMPFVQLVKQKMETVGLSALNLTLDFNEFDVLEKNKEYLKNTLGVSKYIRCKHIMAIMASMF